MVRRMIPSEFLRRAGACFLALALGATASHAQRPAFQVHEATIADLQRAIQNRRVTTVGVVEQYLRRIKAYNGTVRQRAARNPRAGDDDPACRADQCAVDAQSEAGGARTMGLRRAEGAQPHGSRGRRRRHARRARNRGRPGPRVRAHGEARRPSPRRGDRHQGPVRHERHANDVGRRCAVRERSSAG